MTRSVLASVHLSSICPKSTSNVVFIDTARSDVPLPKDDPHILLEHATYSSIFTSEATGNLFVRVIHGGMVLEITSESTSNPVRFSFPAPIMSSPAVLLHQLSELRIFAVTIAGSLYTLTFPISVGDGLPVFDVSPPTRAWCKEYLITTPAEDFEGPVHVKDINCVLIGLNKGRFLILDGDQDYNVWHENIHRIKGSWTSYLVSDSEESHIVSFASHPPPTDSVLVFTLSRDCTLRAWNHGICVASYSIKKFTRTSASPAPRGETPVSDLKKTLLDPEPRTLIRILTTSEDDNNVDDSLRILAFIPTSTSLESGGWFHLFRISPSRAMSKEIYHVRSIPCTARTAGAELHDFIIHNSSLYVLWDQQGKPMVEYTPFDPEVDVLEGDIEGVIWHAATYPPETELTPDYLDELLLRSGGASLIDTFVSAILRPGVFSYFTIETALQQYTESLQSLPGPQPGPLKQSYVTLIEHLTSVVGCTVNVTVDPRTGAVQRTNYWIALKRDWEGFVARCREIERSGRWPLSLGVSTNGNVLIMERERIGRVAPSDQPLEIQISLDREESQKDPFLRKVFQVGGKLSSAEIYSREAAFQTMVNGQFGYSYSERLEDCVASIDDPREDLTQALLADIDDIDDLSAQIQRVLDVVGSTRTTVKIEEDSNKDDGSLLINSLPQATRWSRGVVTAYVNATIEARYRLCLNLLVFLFHIGNRRSDLSLPLLSQIFATFRSISILRFLAWQPAGDPDGTYSIVDEDASILRGFQNMAVSSGVRGAAEAHTPTYSLMHYLMEEAKAVEAPLPDAVFTHFNFLGFLNSQDVGEVTLEEVSLCKWLFDLGFQDTSLEVISRLPQSPGIAYVHGWVLLKIGRADDGASLLQRVGANFGPGAILSAEDRSALQHVLPKTNPPDYNEYMYYRWLGEAFERDGYLDESVRFYKLAIELSDMEDNTNGLWRKVISGYTELGMFEDAYMAIVSTPYETIKQEAVAQLVQAMCESNAVDRLMSLNFVGLPNEVENALRFKVRNADPLSRPMYPHVLYAWYVFRGDFRNAAAIMYTFARRLSPLLNSPQQFVTLAELQAQAYLVAMNALSLIDPKSAWISMPVTAETVSQNRKRRKLSKHIPDDKYQAKCKDTEVIDLADLRQEYTLITARLDIIKRQPELLHASQQFLSATQIVSSYAQAGLYDQAMSAARNLSVDMTELFERLTIQCLRLARRGEAYLQEEGTEWLHTERVALWPGTTAERGWRYLRVSLEQHDTSETDYAYRKATAEKILEYDRAGSLPSWLVVFFQEHQPDYLIRTSLRFDLVGDALEHSLALIKKANTSISRGAGSTWLPYGLIDAVIETAESQKDLTPEAHNRLGDLKSEVLARVKRMQKWSIEAQVK